MNSFFNNIDKFMESNYVPSTDDVLRARVRTTGIQEAEFKFEDIIFRFVSSFPLENLILVFAVP